MAEVEVVSVIRRVEDSSGSEEDLSVGRAMLSLSSNEEDLSGNLKMEEEKPSWRKFASYIGPAVLVSIAFMDPGMLASDLQGGAKYIYELLWVILVMPIGGLIIQYLASNLGVATGKHLAEHYREEHARNLNLILWFLSELGVIVADILEEIVRVEYNIFMSRQNTR